MTYCVAIKVRGGLVALADGRITAGNQVTSARKLSLHGKPQGRILVMTSGLRSVRDKTVAYFDRGQPAAGSPRTMLDAVNAFAACLRRVAEEDKAALLSAGLGFDLHALIGGRLEDDAEPTFFLVYPEGNWIEVDERTPYLSIGATTYGKPILDRALRYDSDLRQALKVAYLSFDSTRFSSTNVGFPIDLASFLPGENRWRSVQFDDDALREQRLWWNHHITDLVTQMPDGPWTSDLLSEATILPLRRFQADPD